MHATALALFPGGLGDLLCCWPALRALADSSPGGLALAARDAWLDVLPAGAVTPLSIDRHEIADLFGRGTLAEDTRRLFGGFARIESWTGAGDENVAARLSAASGGSIRVHPFRAFAAGEHAAQYYARCLGVAPIVGRLSVRADATAWAARWWQQQHLGSRVLAIHPGSGSPHKNWAGMAALALAWRHGGGQVLIVCGPAENERGSAIPHDAMVRDEQLARVAALLVHAAGYLGNDSGISHLAAQVGARTVALFGSTDPSQWRPIGEAVQVLHAPAVCRACSPHQFCTHRLAVDAVLQTLSGMLR